jgi:hypothetical protein
MRGKCDGRPGRDAIHSTTADALPDQNRCHKGPPFTSTGPPQESPPLSSFVSPWGRPFCGAECRADVSTFSRILDDAVPTVRSGCVGNLGRPSVEPSAEPTATGSGRTFSFLPSTRRRCSDGQKRMRGKCDGRPGRDAYTVQRPMRCLDRNRCHEGSTIHFDRPRQEPPPLTS